jgi:hypothetical protein
VKLNGYDDALEAIKVIEKNKSKGNGYADFSKFSPCYKFSNENLSDYYSKFNIDGGNVLTVCGSGDQVLSSILYGASYVDCFDSNLLTYYNLMLKIYCIKYLDFDEFLYFFELCNAFTESNKTKNIYAFFKDKIDDDNIRIFFNLLFNSKINIKYLYNNSEFCFIEDLVSSIPYLNVQNYYKLKGLIDVSKISFTVCDLFDVFNFFDKQYSFVNLSNICDYIDNLIPFYDLIKNMYLNHLNDNGGIMIGYSWTRPHYNSKNNMIAEILDAYQTSVKSVGYSLESDSDSIIYKKKSNFH